jgi:hypothetical protein
MKLSGRNGRVMSMTVVHVLSTVSGRTVPCSRVTNKLIFTVRMWFIFPAKITIIFQIEHIWFN